MQRNHVFATTGDHVVGVRVEDSRGAIGHGVAPRSTWSTRRRWRSIGGPGVLDLGATGTYTDASTDDGSIVVARMGHR